MGSLDMFFQPRSIAIVGASNKELTIPHRIMTNLMNYGYKGPIYPVHPKQKIVKGLTAYPSVLEIPGDVDLAHIVVRRDLVPVVLRQCAEKGIQGAVVNTSGFREIGGEGAKAEDELRELARELGVRVWGPNCQGMMNTDPDVSLYSNFTFARIKPGNISIMAQGGGVAELLNSYISELGIGVRMYASNGNAADVSIPEILAYWDEDPETHVILLHIESFADPAEFLEVVSKIKKPILGMKSGTSPEGARAVASHTGLLMKEDTLTDVLFERCGVLRFRRAQELCEAALAFANQPLPQGRRVGVVTNAGSPAILATDEGVSLGLKMPDPTEETQAHLREHLFATSSVHNPVDMMATATPEDWGLSLEALFQDPNFDIVMTSFITPFFVDCEGVARELVRVRQKYPEKPMIVCLMTNPLWEGTRKILEEGNVPIYYFPESSARAAAALADCAALAKRPAHTVPQLEDIDQQAAAALLRGAPAGFLPTEKAISLLRHYGIPAAKDGWASTPEEARLRATEIGYPVVLKAEVPDLVHKTEAGAVEVNILNEEELNAALKRLSARLETSSLRFHIQEFLPEGTELIIGATSAGTVGHTVMFGLGGVFVEVMRDVRFGLAPLSRNDALKMMHTLQGSKILEGFRGKPGIDLRRVEDILLRVSQLVSDHPSIEEMDLNPIIAYPDGEQTRAVDVRIRVAPLA